MFQIVKVNGRDVEPILDAEGKVRVYPNAKSAALAARNFQNMLGCKVQPRPINDEVWKQREQARFDSGEYQRLPEWFRHRPEHYAHHATGRDGMISFTDGPEKGAADRQTRIKPGTYLARFFPELGDYNITSAARSFAEAFDKSHVLKLATTPEEIVRVYVNGPNSCMSGGRSAYHCHGHPTEVYASGDLAVAYITDPGSGKPTARAVVWPEKKQYVRIYGDSNRLLAALRDEGYQQGTLEGARLVKELQDEDNKHYKMPFLDGCGLARDDGEFLVIDSKGYITCTGTEGYARDESVNCGHCQKRSHSAYCYTVRGLGTSAYWCNDCRAAHAWQDGNTGTWWSNEVPFVSCTDGTKVHEGDFKSCGGFQCSGTGLFYRHGGVLMHDGTKWSSEWFAAHGFRCSVSLRHYPNELMSQKRPGVAIEFEDHAAADMPLNYGHIFANSSSFDVGRDLEYFKARYVAQRQCSVMPPTDLSINPTEEVPF